MYVLPRSFCLQVSGNVGRGVAIAIPDSTYATLFFSPLNHSSDFAPSLVAHRAIGGQRM